VAGFAIAGGHFGKKGIFHKTGISNWFGSPRIDTGSADVVFWAMASSMAHTYNKNGRIWLEIRLCTAATRFCTMGRVLLSDCCSTGMCLSMEEVSFYRLAMDQSWQLPVAQRSRRTNLSRLQFRLERRSLLLVRRRFRSRLSFQTKRAEASICIKATFRPGPFGRLMQAACLAYLWIVYIAFGLSDKIFTGCPSTDAVI